MAQDYFKPKGRTKSSKPDAGGGTIRSEPVLGVVKNNIDPVRAGRLQVYISDFGAPDPEDSSSWVTVSYMTPFFGSTKPTSSETGFGSYIQNPSSYGMWNSPPDIGSSVICIFINGDMNYGFWIGCAPEPELLQMVPAIGAVDNIVPNAGEAKSYGGAPRLPVTNINTNNASLSDSSGFLTQPKPVHSFQASIMAQQGLIRDPIRGPISSSAQRESPSRVGWGVSTPGRPIYQGGYSDADIPEKLKEKPENLKVISRRGGHSLVMDDGDLIGRDQLIRLRTALGHQILMSDDGQTLFIIHSNGQSYIELGKEGTIDMYATNSVNIRTQGDLNLHADNNINLNAKKNLNVSAENINVNADQNFGLRAGGNYNAYTLGNFSVKVNGSMSMGAGGAGSYASSGIMFLNGSKLNLNSGSTSAAPSEVQPIPIIAHTDTLFDATKGYAAAPGKLMSIVSRAPAHAPWANANQGVDVKTSTSASKELPAAPSANLAEANKQTSQTPDKPVTAATAATVPATKAITPAVDKNVTSTLVGGVAKTAAETNPDVVKKGAAVITGLDGKQTAGVGMLAQTPKQLEKAGIIKPGSASLVDSLIQGGKTVAASLTNNLFTGKGGATSLASFANSLPKQVSSQVSLFTSGLEGLKKSGLVTGNESAGQLGGAITAAAQVGIKATTDFLKSASGSISSGISSLTSSLSGSGDALTKSMSSGNFAANLGSSVTGGLNSLTTSLTGLGKSLSSSAGGLLDSAKASASGLLDSAKGVAGSAFSAITASFKPLEAGKPQNLTAINEKNAAERLLDDAGKTLSSATSALSSAGKSLTAGVTGALASAQSSVSGLISGATSNSSSSFSLSSLTSKLPSASQITNAIPKVASLIGSTKIPVTFSSSIASGINSLPGGQGAISSITNLTTGKSQQTVSLSSVADIAKNLSASVTNGAKTLSNDFNKLSNSLGGTSKLPTDFNQLSNSMAKGAQSLTSLVSTGLSPSAAASLSSAISAISSGGPFQIKMPTIGEGTNDRTEVAAQTKSLLGDSRVPAPSFTGVVVKESELNKARAVTKEELIKLVENQRTVVYKIKDEYQSAIDNYPAGDPAIVAQRDKYYAEKKVWADLIDQLEKA